jgi:integrase/recombinase XerD
MDRPEGKRSRAAKRRKAPPGCYWRADTLWGKVVIQGKEFRWSLHTSDPGVAAQRRAEGKERAHSDAYHKSDIPRSLSEALVHWGKHLEREVENRNLSAKTEQRYLVSIGQLAPHLDGLRLTNIDARLIASIIRARQEGGATNATIKRDLVALSSVMNFAIAQAWIDSNPVIARMATIKEGRDPIVLPRRQDIDRVIERAPGMIGHLIRAAALIGTRQDELVRACRDHIDHERGQLTVVGKGNKLRVIDLRPMGAYEFLCSLPTHPRSPLIFWHGDGEPYRNLSSNFFNNVINPATAWAEANGVDFHRFRYHDLRHLHAVEFLKKGCGSIYELQQRLGHSSVKTTEMYLAFLTEEERVRVKYGRQLRPVAVHEFVHGAPDNRVAQVNTTGTDPERR